ncbi:Lrp/AsnC family transcriptional regulator [uncultured Desulfobacter sp.]|uniref:Lrp/AsnC family transcriptional regulator n=1 Tax=uncultured Desulfobacter sp. TaxID=240139 RepID=UPI0029F4BDF3|nr:Lrp/AsnC family transcriptional regulator [uncultured Desulfobacter sp.]
MDLKFESLLDNIGEQVLQELSENARISFSELGRKVGLSSPAVTERVKKMEEAGIIKGYKTVIDKGEDTGKIMAFIVMTTLSQHYKKIKQILEAHPGTLECHHLSGEDSLMIKVTVKGMEELEALVKSLGTYGKTRTSIVLSTFLNKTP